MNLKDKIHENQMFCVNDYIMDPYYKICDCLTKERHGYITGIVMNNTLFRVLITENHIRDIIKNSHTNIFNSMKTDILNSLSV